MPWDGRIGCFAPFGSTVCGIAGLADHHQPGACYVLSILPASRRGRLR
jgi:hypothetical protein